MLPETTQPNSNHIPDGTKAYSSSDCFRGENARADDVVDAPTGIVGRFGMLSLAEPGFAKSC
jgi:hypothetical protein